VSDPVSRGFVQGKGRTLFLSMPLSGNSAFTMDVRAGEVWVTSRGIVDWVAKAGSGLVSGEMGPSNDAYVVLALALEQGLGLHYGGQRRYCH
jgi:hypothetical protein